MVEKQLANAFDNLKTVGIVTPVTHSFDEPLTLACGRTLDRYDIVYENLWHAKR